LGTGRHEEYLPRTASVRVLAGYVLLVGNIHEVLTAESNQERSVFTADLVFCCHPEDFNVT
jgi:hypothetical protein